jgi:hypothetical protein
LIASGSKRSRALDVRVSGEYLTYTGSPNWVEPPFFLKLYHVPTRTETHLEGDGVTETGIIAGAIRVR